MFLNIGTIGTPENHSQNLRTSGCIFCKGKNMQYPDRKVPDHIQIKHDKYNLANVNGVKLSQHHIDKISLVKKFCSGPVTGPQTAV